ncbi:efflux transporter periplasmic adaptor subunit [Enterovibrio norvegicus FF-33]|uniref:efflux RND transporter periplasmic adaptor subunit n=1 Tax=Enterovibrio TaxID=188143 RepID=UPI00030DA843|nr:efflux RND transporter periplasmic adaptor subunit [Enterovibrio norvegicus]OEE67025.1 efflux transporter periplasmic adaptor subunit [Enterovibrio norvegicus FF-33]OEE82412.1 efflux transporter periplasmic adaptor subunit [Enterovibrio norvegicus FF-162]
MENKYKEKHDSSSYSIHFIGTPVKYAALPLIALFVLAACTEPPISSQVPVQNVEVLEVGENDSESKLHFPAIASAADKAALSFLVAGEVDKIFFKPGELVTKGTVLATIDPINYKLAADNAQAKFNVADSQYRRSKPLVEKGSLAKSQFDELAAQRQIAKAELDIAKLKLSYTSLKAPVDGVVSRVPVEQFENVAIGQTILNIHDATQVDVRLQVPDVMFTRHGDRTREENSREINPSVQTDDGKTYTSKVKEFTAEPDPTTGSFMVTLTMPMPEDKFILDGMTVEVVVKENGLVKERANILEVPLETLFNEDGDGLNRDNKFVWVVGEDNRVEKRHVTVGALTPTGVLVVDGLSKGEKVVSAGVNKLRAKQPVNVLMEGDAN